MPLPDPSLIVWILGTFIVGWGMSIVWRALAARFTRDRRRCPACGDEVPPSAGKICGKCLNVVKDEQDFHQRSVSPSLVVCGTLVIAVGTGVFIGGFFVEDWVQERSSGGIGAWHGAGFGIIALAISTAFWAIRGDRSNGRRRCPRCWYEIRTSGFLCTECGHRVGRDEDFYRTKRRPRGVAVALLLVLLAAFVLAVPRVRRMGWTGLIPTTVLIGAYPWLPDSMIDGAWMGGSGVDSLTTRYQEREGMWGWQRRWLCNRAHARAVSTSSAHEFNRAVMFAERVEDSATQSSWIARIQRDLESDVREDNVRALGVLQLLRQTNPDAAVIRFSQKQAARVTTLLDDPDPEVVGLAAASAPLLDAGTPDLLTKLLRAASPGTGFSARNTAWIAAQSAASMLAARRAPEDELRKAIESRDARLARGAMTVAGQFGPVKQPQLVELLVAALRQPDDSIALAAAERLPWAMQYFEGASSQVLFAELVAQALVRNTRPESFVPRSANFAHLPCGEAEHLFRLFQHPQVPVRDHALAMVREFCAQADCDKGQLLGLLRKVAEGEQYPPLKGQMNALIAKLEEADALKAGHEAAPTDASPDK